MLAGWLSVVFFTLPPRPALLSLARHRCRRRVITMGQVGVLIFHLLHSR